MDLPRDLPDGPTADNVVPLRRPMSPAATAAGPLRHGGALRSHAAQAVALAIGRRGAGSRTARARLALAPEPAVIADAGDRPALGKAQDEREPARAMQDAPARLAETAPFAVAAALDALPPGSRTTAAGTAMRWSALNWHYRAWPHARAFRVF